MTSKSILVSANPEAENINHNGIEVNFVNPCLVDSITRAAVDMLKTAIDKYKLIERVDIYVTLHGHIAIMQRKPENVPMGMAGKPARMNAEDTKFFAELPAMRWFEIATDKLSIAFDDDAFK